jgi:hypothetical protein
VYSRGQLGAAWREVSSATLFRLHNGDVEQSNPSLHLKPDTDRHWRVVVDTRNGGLGSGALSVAAGWSPATLSFVARGSAPFTLGVGNAAAVSAAVNRDELLMGASSVAATARVGELLTVAQHANAQSAANAGAYRRYMLWAALLLAVGSLAAIAWRLARGVQHAMPRGDAAAAVPGTVTSGFANAPVGASDPASAASASSLDATNPMTGSSGTSGAEVGRQRDGRD